MRNEKYWTKRALEDEEKSNSKALEVYKKQVITLKNTEIELKNIINKYLHEMSNDYNVSMIELKKILTSKEKEELNWKLKDYVMYSKKYETYIKSSPEAIELDKKLKNASRHFRMNKQQALVNEINKEIVRLGVEQIKTLETHLSENFKNVNEAIYEKWVGNKNFSDRIWGDVDNLNKFLEQEIPKSISRGDGGKKLINDLSNKINTSKLNAKRLVLTESSRIYSKSRIKSFKALGVKYVKLVATLDLRTSNICQNKDGNKVKLKSAIIGVDLPPFHPYCRTTFVAVLDMELASKFNKRVAKSPIDNKSYNTSSKDYKEWKQSYLPKDNITVNQGAKDRYKDKRDYKKMKKILKKEIPKTLEEYRKMRYNDVEKYEELKRSFNTLKKIKSKKWNKSFKVKAIKTYYEFKNKGIEVSDHFLSRYLNSKRNVIKLNLDDILKLKEKPIKYKEFIPRKNTYNLIRYEKIDRDYIRLITNNNDKELISIIFDTKDKVDTNVKDSKWEEYK